jgi:hypothetical protein
MRVKKKANNECKSDVNLQCLMSVKRACECERALEVFNRFLNHIMEELPLNVATHQSPLLGTTVRTMVRVTNQVGNKIVLLRNNNQPIKNPVPNESAQCPCFINRLWGIIWPNNCQKLAMRNHHIFCLPHGSMLEPSREI